MMNALRNADQKRVNFARGIRTGWAGLPTWIKFLIGVVGVAILFYLPRLNILPFAYIRTDISEGGSDWPSTLFTVAIYVMIAVGLNIVIGLAGLLDLGYVGFFAIGAYSVALFGSPDSPVTQWIAGKFGLDEGWAVVWAVCVPIAIALTMVSGVILGAPTLRLRGDYLAIVTMGFGEIVRIVARNSDFTNASTGITGIPRPPGPEVDGRPYFNVLDIERWYWLALVALLIFVFLVRRLEHSRVGRSWVAIREDEDAAAIMGVPAFKFKLWAFAMGAALGGFSGLLFASKQTAIEPNQFSLNLSFLFVAMVVIGGSGNMLGVVFGAILITYIPEKFREVSEWRPFLFGVALVVVMVLRPQGLIPSRRRAREFADRKREAEEATVSA